MPKNTPGSIDDLFDTPPTAEEKSAVAESKQGGPAEPTPEQQRIAELERQIAELTASRTPSVGPEDKTPEQKVLEHNQAVAANSAFERASENYDTANSSDDDIVFHMLVDGITFAGRVWYAGQTVRFPAGGRAYEESKDRNGNSWLDDLSDKAQLKRFGRVVLKLGPWTGPEFKDAIAIEDQKRGDAAPVITL